MNCVIRKRQLIIKALALTACGCFLLGCGAVLLYPDADDFQPRLQIQQGQTWKGLYTKRETGRTTENAYMEIDNTNDTEAYFNLAVKQVDRDGTTVLEIVLTRVIAETKGTAGEEKHDSANPEPGAEYLQAFNGHRFEVKISPEGRILGIKGFADIFDRILAHSDDADPVMKRKNTLDVEQLKKQFNDAAIAELMMPLFDFYPPEPVAMGESWKRNYELHAFIPYRSETTLTLNRQEGDLVFLDRHSYISPHPDQSILEVGYLKYRFNLTGVETGSIVYNKKDGMIRRGEYHIEGDAMITMYNRDSAPAQAEAEKLEVPMHLTIDMRFQLE